MSNTETKTIKAPGALRKPIKKQKFLNKFEKHLEHPQDKNYFVSCFTFENDIYTIKNDITKDDVRKLKALLIAIKINSKASVKTVPLLFASAIIAAIVIFFTVFANPLLGRALELGLETLFEARAEVRGFRLSLIKFEISVRSIVVANRDSPMTNLFQISTIRISLRPQAVLRGKIYIEEIRADEIRFGTERKVSGTLPGRPPRTREEREKTPAPPLVDLQNFDANALLEQEFDKLISPKIYDEAIKAYNEAAEKWPSQVESAGKRVEELRAVSQPLINLNVSEVRDADSIRRTIQDITNAINTVQAATNDVNNIVTGIESDINNARRLEANARNAINDDINHLRSYLDLGSGAAFHAIEPFIRNVLSDAAEQYLDYGIIALDVLEKLKAMSASRQQNEKPKKEVREVFRGRTVHYPTVTYPAFFLGIFASDFTIDSWNWSFDLRSISSNPDVYPNKPVTLEFGLSEQDENLHRKIGFNGMADFRSDPTERFNAVLSGNGFPFSIGDQLNNIGINGFTGESDFSVNMSGLTSGAISAGGNVVINKAQLIEPSGTLAEAVGVAVREAGSVRLGLQFSENHLSITTNIADLIANALRRTAEVYARRAIADLEQALRQKINEYIDGQFESRDQVDALLRTARGDKAAIEQASNALNAKKNEFEQRLRGLAGEAGQSLLQNIPRLR
ncbi:MAG: hypothetical protein FWD28_03970 [Treponema sp.]|nr:hypothetical protein [Treponema sp.]